MRSTVIVVAACFAMLLPWAFILSHWTAVDTPYADSLDHFMSGAPPRSRAEDCFFRLLMTYPGAPHAADLRDCANAHNKK